MICQSYSNTYNLKVGIIRSANIFGECDLNLKRIFPETIISILKNKKLIIRSSGKQKYLSKSKSKLKIYNIGSNYNLTTIQIVKKIYKLANKKPNFEVKNYSKSEIKNQRLNYNKIKAELNWMPIFSLSTSIIKTINWYRKNIKRI